MTAAVRCTNSAHIGLTLLPCLCDSSAHKGVWVAKQKKSPAEITHQKNKKKSLHGRHATMPKKKRRKKRCYTN